MADSDKPIVMFASIGDREDHVEHSLTQKERSNAESTVSQAKLVEQKAEFWRGKLANPAKPRLFTYLMTHDHGFAPNPFHGVLTLV